MRRYLTTDDVVRKTGIPATLLARWRSDTYRTGQQVGPVFVKLDERKGSRAFYPADLLARWLEWHERRSAKTLLPSSETVLPRAEKRGAGGT